VDSADLAPSALVARPLVLSKASRVGLKALPHILVPASGALSSERSKRPPHNAGSFAQDTWAVWLHQRCSRALLHHMFCTMSLSEPDCRTLKLLVCLHVCARVHCLPLTIPPITSAAAPPPPPHIIVGIDACCMQCGGRAVCCEERFAGRGGRGGGPIGVNINSKHARQGGPAQRTPTPPVRATVTRAPTQTDLAPSRAPWAREGAQRGTCRPGAPCPGVHRSASRDHRPDAQELRCPAINTLCRSA